MHRVLVAAHDRAGDPAGGLRAADAALSLTGTPIWTPQARRLRARFLAALGHTPAEVFSELDLATAAAEQIGAVGPRRLIDDERTALLPASGACFQSPPQTFTKR